ncbi:hypothetical protein ACJ41O_010351 [Fusarium nematophilum]
MEVAPVQWWNAHGVFVLCPLCDSIHRHEFDGEYSQDHGRVALCDTIRHGRYRDRMYEFNFPFDQPTIVYEIDKSKMRLVAAGARFPKRHVSDDEEKAFREHLRNEFDRKPKWTDGIERDTFSRKKIDLAVEKVVVGHVEWVDRYLDTAREVGLFLQGVEGNTLVAETSGRTTLHLAARGNSPRMVELLLSRGADVNATDLYGRTPLMEAALWGRLENVKLLLKHGADRNRIRIEANEEIRAVDLAKHTLKNADRRRSHGSAVYKEDTSARNLDRRAIVRLLKDASEEPNLPKLGSLALQKCGSGGLPTSLTSHYTVPNVQRTVAVLVRGEGLADVSAMTCWSRSGCESIRIANRDWSDEVLSLYKQIRFPPEYYTWDRGTPGQFKACHAKQLIAWFVHNHVFLSAEMDFSRQEKKRILLRNLLLSGKLPVDHRERLARQVEQLDQDIAYKMRLLELRRAAPSESLKSALILVNSDMRPCCWRFATRVNDVLGLQLQIHYRCMERSCNKGGNCTQS